MNGKRIVLFGPTLFLLRNLARNGFDVVVVTSVNEYASKSKYGEKYIVSKRNSIDRITEIINAKYGEGLPAIACNEKYLNLILYDNPGITEKFKFIMADESVMKLFLRKKDYYCFCKREGIKYPEIFNAGIDSGENINGKYPIFAKRNHCDEIVEKMGIPKGMIIESDESLKEYLDKYDKDNEGKGNYVLQKFLGSEYKPVSMGGFYRKGEEVFSIVVEQRRQYPLGISSFVVEAEDTEWAKKVRENTLKIVELTDYTGFLEVEYRTDGNEVFLLDINPRLWKWGKIVSKKIPDFAECIFSNREPIRNPEIVKWVDLRKDAFSLIYSKSSRKSFSIRDYFPPISFDIIDLKDLGPLVFLFNRKKRMRKRYKNRAF